MVALDGIRHVLLDIDGTLLRGDRMIPGAAAAVSRLRRRNLGLRLVSNMTRRSSADVARLLTGQGMPVAPEEVLLPASLAGRRIVESGRLDALLLVSASSRDDLSGVHEVDRHPDWVVVGDLGPLWDFPTLNRAFRCLRDGATLLALHRNPHWNAGADGPVIDAGAFVAALEYAAGVTAEVMGKPSPRFFELALADLGAVAAETLMVGDNVDTDGRGAAAAGCRSALVLTGNFDRADRPEGFQPDLVLESVADLFPNDAGGGV